MKISRIQGLSVDINEFAKPLKQVLKLTGIHALCLEDAVRKEFEQALAKVKTKEEADALVAQLKKLLQPKKKPKKKERDWALEIRQLREAEKKNLKEKND